VSNLCLPNLLLQVALLLCQARHVIIVTASIYDRRLRLLCNK
jgi:hypothetical protein